MLSLHKRGSGRQWAAGIIMGMAAFGAAGCGNGVSGSNNSPVPTSLVGSWGGSLATDRSGKGNLTVTSTGAILSVTCYEITISQPIQPDSTGRFTAQGALLGGPPSVLGATATVSGQVTGRTMTLITPLGTYVLTYDTTVTVPVGTCPA